MYVADVTSLFGLFVKFVVEEVGGGYTVVNPRRACAARVTVVGLSVCLSTTILALQATRRFMSDTNSFSATRA